ncbi:hypothetical protein ACFO5X_10145 [Seohaeicola nanhaiensis]|uniref:Uncharacterized protein n=1 Tax=Seohaeicola nanhaiensis TaxID=1387282 RepID=A0ABV9KFP3_9RHOB
MSLLFANNLTSAVVILACWWLAHINAKAVPPGRAVAAGYALVGISVLFTMMVRNLAIETGVAVAWLVVLTKAALGTTLLLTIYRRAKLGEK